MVSPNDSKMNGSSCSLSLFIAAPDLLYWHFSFTNYQNISHELGLVTEQSRRHHWKAAWASTICHETKQASLSNLCNINNSMPHFCTHAGGGQYYTVSPTNRRGCDCVLIQPVQPAASTCRRAGAFKGGNPPLLGRWPEPTDAARWLCITLKSALIPNRLGLVLHWYSLCSKSPLFSLFYSTTTPALRA